MSVTMTETAKAHVETQIALRGKGLGIRVGAIIVGVGIRPGAIIVGPGKIIVSPGAISVGLGIGFMAGWAVVLILAAWTLTSAWMRGFYLVLSSSTALNAIFAVKSLFGDTQEINGEEFPSDAATMGELKFGTSLMWALLWLFLGLACLLGGCIFAIPGPDETAEFRCCRACQKAKCFACCNAPGCRLWARMRGRHEGSGDNGSISNGGSSDPVV